MYNTPANGLAEALNKTLYNLLKKVVSKPKRDWYGKLGEVLWAYHTSYRTPIQSTPYALVYEVEIILPLEIQILSLCIMMQEGFHGDENNQLWLKEGEALDEKTISSTTKIRMLLGSLSPSIKQEGSTMVISSR